MSDMGSAACPEIPEVESCPGNTSIPPCPQESVVSAAADVKLPQLAPEEVTPQQNKCSPASPASVPSDLLPECSRPLSNDSGVGTSASDTDLASISSNETTSRVLPTGTSPVKTHAQKPESPQHPQKRKPGRPPGSTKKYRQGVQLPGEEGNGVFQQRGTDFTLRKFFEAGGRDYNEYLEWLKRRDNGENVPFLNTQITQPAALIRPNHPPMAAPPVPMGVPQGPLVTYPPMPYMQRPLVPVPQNPTVTRFRPLTSQAMPNQIRLNTGMPYFPVIPPQPETQPPQQPQPLRRPADGALDLSAKKPRLDKNANLLSIAPGFPDACAMTPSPPQQRLSPPSTPGRVIEGQKPTEEKTERLETPVPHPMRSWGVEEVANFVAGIPGCQDYAEVFREQKIDGATLPHLSEEHLLNFVKMKLGPAIRLRLEVKKLTQIT